MHGGRELRLCSLCIRVMLIVCAVDQVLDLITVYEGNKPNGTEKELRRRLNDHIGVVTTFG